MSKELLQIKNLYANAETKEILKGLNLTVNKGEVHVIMGPNGAGKSTTASVIFNSPEYKKVSGEIEFEGENINDLSTDKIAKKGIFMSFQSPEEIPGISTMNFLKYAKNKIEDKPVKVFQLKEEVKKYIEELNMNPNLINRDLNVGFSGGEKKKNEILQVQNYELKDAETSPPSRYNSGNLVLAMENAGKLIEEEELREQIKGAGIGTSATRGEIIKKLEKIQYIQINSKTQIVTPTVKGEAIYDVVYQAMPDILNPKLTASWEKGLDMVAKKEIEPQVFMDKLENYIRSKFDKLVVKM